MMILVLELFLIKANNWPTYHVALYMMTAVELRLGKEAAECSHM